MPSRTISDWCKAHGTTWNEMRKVSRALALRRHGLALLKEAIREINEADAKMAKLEAAYEKRNASSAGKASHAAERT